MIEFTEDGSCVGYGLDEATNTWTKEALFANGLGNTNSQKENAYRPLISGVAPEVFELDSKTGLYNICSELTPYIGFDCFVPAIQAPQELGGYGTGCSIKLENGTIKEIVLDFYYNNGFRERIGTVTVEFSNVGTTTLPSDITLA